LKRVSGIDWEDGRPRVKSSSGLPQVYDLIVGAVGVNTNALKLFEDLEFGYRPPQATKTYVSELAFGQETVQKYLGDAMHVFLLNLPRLKFAALIPKGDYVPVCMLGERIDRALVQAFLDTPEVKRCLPPNWDAVQGPCHCSPRMNIRGAVQPFADRVVLIGDCGVSRLYKDGIGAAYRTAKAAATTAIFHGISGEDFGRGYWPICRGIATDNTVGKVVFTVTRLIQMTRFSRYAVLDMVGSEQQQEGSPRWMSGVLWDTFTGSAPYRDVFLRSLHPGFLSRFFWNIAVSIWPF
jgi:hypothetical protein